MFSIVKLAVVTLIAVVAAYMAYDALEGPEPVVIGNGKATSKSHFSDKVATAATRQLQRGSVTYWQVRTPGGAWLDCSGDCAETYRREILDYWETRDEEGPGDKK